VLRTDCCGNCCEGDADEYCVSAYRTYSGAIQNRAPGASARFDSCTFRNMPGYAGSLAISWPATYTSESIDVQMI
jgi:hypothetical protein